VLEALHQGVGCTVKEGMRVIKSGGNINRYVHRPQGTAWHLYVEDWRHCGPAGIRHPNIIVSLRGLLRYIYLSSILRDGFFWL
jgi:hypothetical protein